MSAAHTTTVGCSQCGGSFGPGTEGFSHCTDHAAAPVALTISLALDGKPIDVALQLDAADARRLAGPLTFRRDELLDSILRNAVRRLDIALRARFTEGASTAQEA